MKSYKTRPGIVCTRICGKFVLIPSREASRSCATILPLPLIWAATWKALASGKTLEETVRFHQSFTKKSEAEVLEKLEEFYEMLYQKGFLIVEEEE